MKRKWKPCDKKDKDKKIILWEVKSFPAIEIKGMRFQRTSNFQETTQRKRWNDYRHDSKVTDSLYENTL